MRTVAFLDCPTGISGDMCLGAIVSAGVPLTYLQEHLDRLNLPETVKLREQSVHRNHIVATKVEVVLPHETQAGAVHPPMRRLQDIEQIITTAPLPERPAAWSLAIFQRLAIAEGAVHGLEPQQVHFHEVGATDAIADIVGTCLGLDWLGVDELFCAPLPTGQGTVWAAHGRLPVPVPAVLKLMEMAQVPIYNAGLQGELVTPTGAAIATELVSQFGDPPRMTLRKVGLGAGNTEFPVPNILRLWIGSEMGKPPQQLNHSHEVTTPTTHSTHTHTHHTHTHHTHHDHESEGLESKKAPIEQRQGVETVVVLETQVDDLSPQAIGYLYNHLLNAGALDVFTQAVTMKKSRLGHLITVVCYPESAQVCEHSLLRETTTLGVRRTQQTRQRLRRAIVPMETALGTVRMKVAFDLNNDSLLKVHPEYEDCAALAQEHNLPWREVHNQALCHWQLHHADDMTKGRKINETLS